MERNVLKYSCGAERSKSVSVLYYVHVSSDESISICQGNVGDRLLGQ